MRTGEFRRVGPVQGRVDAGAGGTAGSLRATTRSFANTLTSGYFTTGALGEEWVDWASKSTGQNGLVPAVTFGYATTAQSTSVGGAGASLDLSFYSGATGFCSLGTELGRISFTGLPGRTASVPPGFGVGYVITAFLSTRLDVFDGAIAWGYTFTDSDGMGGSRTGPLLTDFGTNTGWADAYDSWAGAPASLNTCAGTFFFGGCTSGAVPPPPTGTPCASFYLALHEDDGAIQPNSVIYNGSGVNPVVFTHVSGAAGNGPRIGRPWVSAVQLAPNGLASFLAATTIGPLQPGVFPGGIFKLSELLINPGFFIAPPDVSLTGIHTIQIPFDYGLLGLTFTAQSGIFLGQGCLQLTNALLETIGP